MVKNSLPPGFRFDPTDVELVMYYLKRKIRKKKFYSEAIAEVEIYKHAPWDLPGKSCLQSGDLRWYFFCPREKKYASGSRTNRKTDFGFWKTTGNDRSVRYNGRIVGTKKTLIFHGGKSPKAERTNWVMYEYRLEEGGLADRDVDQDKDSFVLSMIFQKDGIGPRNNAQYGAPYKEEDWASDEEDNCVGVGSSANPSVLVQPSSHDNYAANSTLASGSKCAGPSTESCISDCIRPTCQMPRQAPTAYELPQPVSAQPSCHDNYAANSTLASGSKCAGPSTESFIYDCIRPTCQMPQLPTTAYELPHPVSANVIDASLKIPDDDNLALLDCFLPEEICEAIEHDKNEAYNDLDNLYNFEVVRRACNFEGNDIFKDLGDLGNMTGLSEDGCGFSGQQKTMYTMEQVQPGGDFLELMDLDIPLNCTTEAGGYGCIQLHGLGNGYNASNNPDLFCHQTSHCVSTSDALPGQSTPLEKDFENQSRYVYGAESVAQHPCVWNKSD